MGTVSYAQVSAANAAEARSRRLQSADHVWLEKEVPNGTATKADPTRFRPVRDFESS